MLNDDMLESIQEIQEVLENDEFKELTDKQKEVLKDNFNTFIKFEYCDDGSYIFLMSENNFKNFEYYLGMEYEKDYIDTKININGNVLVIYDYDSDRTKELFELLEKNEEE